MASWGITSESQVRAQATYDREHTVRLSLKLNRGTRQGLVNTLGSAVS